MPGHLHYFFACPLKPPALGSLEPTHVPYKPLKGPCHPVFGSDKIV